MNEDFDMEDLEARLYGEVYYNADNTPPTVITSTPKSQQSIVNKTNKPPLDNSQMSVHTKKMINPLAASRALRAKPRYFKESTKPKSKRGSNVENALVKLPNPLNKEVMSKAERIKANRVAKNQRKRQRQKEKRRLEQLGAKLIEKQRVDAKKSPPKANEAQLEIILLSDEEEPPSAPSPPIEEEIKKIDDEKSDTKEVSGPKDVALEEDEEVVFIEPPPVEVINLEMDSESDNEEIDKPTEQNECQTAKSVSQPDHDRSTPDSNTNDFLDSSVLNSASNFNFSLHGNDFQGDFVKPTNPTNSEVYETESSCSTTDLPKDFAAKAVVFNECEFPQGDMFNENNLESFGHYITPKRARLNEQLPDLSPMTSAERLTEKNTNQDESPAKPRRKVKKPSFNEEISTENQNKNKSANAEQTSASPPSKITSEKENSTSLNPEDAEVVDLGKSPVQDSFYHDIPDIEKLPAGLEVVDEVGGSASDAETISDDLDADFRTHDNGDDEIELVNCVSGPSRQQESSEGNLRRFDVDFIQRTMTDDPSMWEISLNDSVHCQYISERGPRCRLCRQIGHIMDECPKRHDPIRCKLCGKRGHSSEKCPNDCCHHCGNKGTFTTLYCYKCVKWRNSVCGICRMKGHSNRSCPDLWRRYCSTTSEGPLNVLQEPQIKPYKDLWCSGCAKNGHLEHNCNYSHRLNPPIDPKVHSFQEVYAVDKKKVTEMVTPATPTVPPVMAGTSSGKKSKNKINPLHFLAKKPDNLPATKSRSTSPVCLIDLSEMEFDSPSNKQNSQNSIPVNFNESNASFAPANRDSNTNFNNNLNPNPNNSNSDFNNRQSFLGTPVWNSQVNQFQPNLSNLAMNQNFDHPQGEPALNMNQRQNAGPFNSTPNRSYSEIPPPPALNNAEHDPANLRHLHSCFRQPAIEGIHVSLGLSFHDLCNIKCFLFKSLPEVQMAIRKELDDLVTVSQMDLARMRERYKQSANNLQNLRSLNPRLKNILYRCFRQLNMMIFGVFRMRDGERHLQVLNQVLEIMPQGHLTKYRRNQIVTSYNYIFGGRKVNSVNYLYFLRIIAERIRKLNN